MDEPRTLFPGLRLLRRYERKDLKADFLGGLVIVLVLIPSTLAYSELAGSGPIGGIYAALAGTLAYFVFASSRHMNVGPDGAVALLAGTAILPLTGGDPQAGLIVGAWLALFTGIVLLTAAKLRLGVLASFLSAPVLTGYLNGAAVVIVVSQFGKLFGIDLEANGIVQRAIEFTVEAGDTHGPTLAVASVVLVMLAACKAFIRAVPPLVPVFLIALLAGLFHDFRSMDVAVIGAIRDITPQGVGFTLEFDDAARLAVGALGLAFLIFPEGLLLGRAMAEKHGYTVDGDRELLALGASNVASGLVTGFAIGGSQTRTLLNSATGGRTQMANLISAGLLVLFLIFGATLIERMPSVAIAAILTFTGFGLVDIAGMRELFRRDRTTGWIALSTMLSVVFIGVLAGILIGTALSIVILLKQLARPHDALLGRKPGSDSLHDLGDDDEEDGIPGILAYRFYGPLHFANVGYFIDRVEMFLARQKEPVHAVILDMQAVPSIDFTAVEKMRPFYERLRERGFALAFSDVHFPLRESRLARELEDVTRDAQIFDDVSDAVRALDGRDEV
ncbi:MAG: SulP family inorganic anion transporter [Planctomycetota bacterium]